MNIKICLALFFLTLVSLSPVQAQIGAQQASGQESMRQLQEKERRLRQAIEQKVIRIEEVPAQEIPPSDPSDSSEKVLIKNIHITGHHSLSSATIDRIIQPYEGQNLTLREMQKVADLITDAYRKKGFITSRAILPPQKVINNTLEIQIVEGVLGAVEVKGNRYFKKSLFTKRMGLKKGEIFNYNTLRDDLEFINRYPDRNVKTIITPGQNAGETDVVLEVKDRLPIHAGFTYDNYGSRYVGQNRFTGSLTHNNLLGFDDILTLQYQGTNAAQYQLTFGRYLVPVLKNTEIGVFAAQNKVEIGKEFADLEARGKSKLYGVFVNQGLISQRDLKLVANMGLDYKDVFNFQLGQETSRDRLRVAKGGLNLDFSDPLGGRNILSNEIDVGIPEIMGGLDDVDSRASRVGSGGAFTKDVLDVLRLQSMPWETALLLKTQFQFSSTILPATEQYQLGGVTNLRGFAPGEAVGDSGQSITAEFSVPVYFIPREVRVPYSKGYLYDSLRVVGFYDWGHVGLRNPQVGEPKARTLDDVGVGVRFDLPEDLNIRLDFAWPITGRPSDGNNQHTWLQVSKDF